MRSLLSCSLATLALLTELTSPVSDKGLLSRHDVREAIVTIRADTAKEHIEVAALVRADGLDYVSGSSGDIDFAWEPGIIAVFHSHPDKGFERPSSVDVRLATGMRIPVYVISVKELWVVRPDGTVEEVKE